MKLINLMLIHVHLLYYLAVQTKMVVCSSTTNTLKAPISSTSNNSSSSSRSKKGHSHVAKEGQGEGKEDRLLKKGKKCKGKKNKSKCTAEPSTTPSMAPSISSQPSISMQPSMQPSISSSPSTSPSSVPTSIPSSHPSFQPSVQPSVHPTSIPTSVPSSIPTRTPSSPPSDAPSNTPSSHPTTEPTVSPSSPPSLEPSVHPSAIPTLVPSTVPTSLPSSVPSLTPSSIPSTMPSMKPSMSMQPSSVPSISSQPSYNLLRTREVVYDENGNEVGIQSGCPPPNEIGNGDERYAEDTLVPVKVEFQYLIVMEESANVGEVLKTVDAQFQEFVFDEYVSCQGNTRNRDRQRQRQRHRRTQDLGNGNFYQVDQAMGVSSLPQETPANGLACADTLTQQGDGQKCIVVDGGLTLFFEKESGSNGSLKEYELLLFLKEQMDDNPAKIIVGDNDDKSDSIKGLVFVQAKNLYFDRGESVVSNLVREEGGLTDPSPTDGITYTGALLIGSAMFLLLGAIVAAFKRKRTKGYAQRDAAVLEMLDREYDGDFDGDEEKDIEFEEFVPPRRKKFHSGYGDASFPVPLKEVHCNSNTKKKYMQMQNVENYDDENDHEQRYSRPKKKQDSDSSPTFPVILTETLNGRYRTSETEADGGGVPRHKVKIISSQWDDEIEIDVDKSSDRISDKTLYFSTPMTKKQQQSKSRKSGNTSSGGGQSLFPIKTSEPRNGRLFSVSRRARQAAAGAGGKKNDISSQLQYPYQDMHHCNSANCQQCQRNSKKNSIKFISSYEGIEVDYSDPFFSSSCSSSDVNDTSSDRISDRTIDFSKPTMHERLYGNQNTLDL